MFDIINGHLAVIAHGPAVLLQIGPIAIRWYSLAYVVGFLAALWVMKRMLHRPFAPMTETQLNDFLLWAILGVVIGGRLGYVLFYNLGDYISHPLEILTTWHGGMSFHGGALGLLAMTILFCRKRKLAWLRVFDYVVVVQPIGQGLGRLANFLNGELWGAPTSLPWGVIFQQGDVPRHPSQLYEFLLEGGVLFALLAWMFWRTEARCRPGMLVGAYCLGFGVFRVLVEIIREPDAQLVGLTGPLQMGQWLSLPMIVGGAILIFRARNRPAIDHSGLPA